MGIGVDKHSRDRKEALSLLSYDPDSGAFVTYIYLCHNHRPVVRLGTSLLNEREHDVGTKPTISHWVCARFRWT